MDNFETFSKPTSRLRCLYISWGDYEKNKITLGIEVTASHNGVKGKYKVVGLILQNELVKIQLGELNGFTGSGESCKLLH